MKKWRQTCSYRIFKNRTEPHKANLKEDYSKIQQAAFAEKQTSFLLKWLDSRIPTFYIKIDEEFNDCPNIAKWNNNTTKNNIDPKKSTQ